jgi:hypothetical protein
MRFLNVVAPIALACAMVPARAEDKLDISLGLRVQGTGWSIEPETGTKTSADASLNGFDVNARYARVFFGAGLVGGTYKFDDAPAPPGATATPAPTTIERGELDITVGFQAWPQVALFAGLKSVAQKWTDLNERVDYIGIGVGVAAFHRFTPAWSIFGSLGRIPSANLWHDGKKIGTGSGTTLEGGALYRIDNHHHFTGGLKVQGQQYHYDSGIDESHGMGALTLRYYYVF